MEGGPNVIRQSEWTFQQMEAAGAKCDVGGGVGSPVAAMCQMLTQTVKT